jgi:hypothetical protein
MDGRVAQADDAAAKPRRRLRFRFASLQFF